MGFAEKMSSIEELYVVEVVSAIWGAAACDLTSFLVRNKQTEFKIQKKTAQVGRKKRISEKRDEGARALRSV